MGKTKFNNNWLARVGPDGYPYSEWCSREDECNAYCNYCKKSISFNLKGIQALFQHAEKSVHIKNIELLNGNYRLKSSSNKSSIVENNNSVETQNVEDNTNKCLKVYNPKLESTHAEVCWCLLSVSKNWSAASSSEDVAESFKKMFPGINASEQFCMGRTKYSYLLTEALGPYFRNKLLDDIKSKKYCLIYDETTNKENKKELQVYVRYWSDEQQGISVNHLETFFIGSAKGEDIKTHLFNAIDNANLKLEDLVMLGSDGPNVNKKVFRLINEEVKSVRDKNLLDIGTCNIHIVHNAFLKGLGQLQSKVSEYIIFIYKFFSKWPKRFEDYEEIQLKCNVPNQRFIKHVSSRWLTIEPAADRVIQQWNALEMFFLKFIPLEQKHLKKANFYQQIADGLKNPIMKSSLIFIVSVSKIFIGFTKKFQSSTPLIHCLYPELKQMTLQLVGRFMKDSVIEKLGNGNIDVVHQALKDNSQYLPIRKFTFGKGVLECVENIEDSKQIEFFEDIRNFFKHSTLHILEKTSLDSSKRSLAKAFRYLHPLEISKNSYEAFRNLKKIADCLPLQTNMDKLKDEVTLFQFEDGIKNNKSTINIDYFWHVLMSSLDKEKYFNLFNFIKCALVLSHGSADVERGFSLSGRIIADDRTSMGLRMLNARLTIYEGLKVFQHKPHMVPISKELLNAASLAHRHYISYMEEQRRKLEEKEKVAREEEEERQTKLKTIEIIKKKEEEVQDMNKDFEKITDERMKSNEISTTLISDAINKINTAVSKRKFDEILVANELLEVALKKNKESTAKDKEIREIIKKKDIEVGKINKKKDNLISNYFGTASKKVKKS